jgi:hypothetical protein
MRRQAVTLALLLALPTAAHARPKIELLPGASQEISHKMSASRDTALPAYQLTPYSVFTAGIDAGLVGVDWGWISARVGFIGMIELESDRPYDAKQDGANVLLPSAGIHYWRGMQGIQASVALDEAGEKLFGEGGLLELTLGLRHESEHYTGSNDGGAGSDYSDVPHIGDFFLQDVAARIPTGRLDFELRLQNKLFLPAGGGDQLRLYRVGPGFDAIVRWRLTSWVHPFSSTFGEYLWGNGIEHEGERLRVPDNHLLRNLTGLIFPGRFGEVQVFTSVSVGHGKGLQVFKEELLWGGGVRIAPF